MHHSESISIDTNAMFEQEYRKKAQLLLMGEPVRRGPAHATTDESMAMTHELMHVTESFQVDREMSAWQGVVKPNLPWAEDHFQERVSGEPLNPAPSEAWWPFARAGNAEHKKDEKFSHTYPERFWPRYAGEQEYEELHGDENLVKRLNITPPRQGIRFEYGDLSSLLAVLSQNPNTRQAYLPIWFPEDLHAAELGERVPCSMGYHFIRDPKTGQLDCVYTMRSCDLVRFYRDDIYMAGRLLQWIADRVNQGPGKLVVHINNLHCFPGDRLFLQNFIRQARAKGSAETDRRSGYNWGALG